ncbi:MAG: hypothetical protein K2L82_03570 [Lachnospiraceae bacterium]|nr:hypothetical protein [Lachnospiraceae bacterium]
MMNMKRSGIIGLIVFGVVLVAIVVGYAFHINRKAAQDAERAVESTEVQKVLMRDLERNYPPTPKEVVKYFAEITKCFYNEDYSEEELEELATKIQGLYDAELIANKSQEDYMADLRSEIASMKKSNYTISSYVLSASVDVEEFVENGYSCARLYCTFNVKQGTSGTVRSMEQFILRKDDDGHWKILGWDLVEE